MRPRACFVFLLSVDRQSVRRNAEGSVPYGSWCKKVIRGEPVDSSDLFCIVRRP